MTEKIFNDRLLNRLAMAIKDIELEGLEAPDLEALDAQDEAIYRAYQERGGDAVAAKRQLAAAKEKRNQAFAHVVQFIAQHYGYGPLDQMSDGTLRTLAQDGFDVCANWTAYVDLHEVSTVRVNRFQSLLDTHHSAEKSQHDLHDKILWPIAKRVSRAERRKRP